MPNFIIGFYQIPGVVGNVIVEAKLVGVPQRDYANLFLQLKKKFPKLQPGEAKRIGSTIESRAEGDEAPFINPNPGMNLRQLFIDTPVDGTGTESFKTVGSVFFDGQSCEITLRYVAEKGVVGVSLVDRLTRNATRFSNQLNASLSVDELPKLIADVLGGNYKDLKVRMMKHPQPLPK